jgi:hypothetical protein
MRQIAYTVLLLSVICSSVSGQTIAQYDTQLAELKSELSGIKKENRRLQNKMEALDKTDHTIRNMIDSMRLQVQSNGQELTKTSEVLDSKIRETGSASDRKFTDVSDSLSKKTLYWITAFLVTALLLILIYRILSRQQKADKSDIIQRLTQTKSFIETSLVSEFGKQAELMETQLRYLEKQATPGPLAPNAEIDHSLAIKVADEITLIERNLNLMDAKTKGLKQLNASIGKLRDNLAANNYEMPQLLGLPFHQGMKVIVTNSIPDSNLGKGEEKISKIIKPQVNFNDKMIQTAQIEVSVGY